MEIYHYHPTTGEYIGASQADPDPLVPGRFLVPAYATTVSPPGPTEKMARIWDGAWTTVEDHRGEQRWDADGNAVTVEALGPVNPSWSKTAPPPKPEPVPQTISFRQLVLAALGAEWITPAEAEAWAARNALPPILSGVIATLPAADQTAARVTALTMAEADRHDPLMIAVATAAGADSEQIDQFFRQAVQL